MDALYILEGTEPVPCDDVLTWGRWLETADRTVAATAVAGGVRVVTEFLGLDHNIAGEGPPLLFETRVVGGALAGTRERCATWREAEDLHDRMVARVCQGLTPQEAGALRVPVPLDLAAVGARLRARRVALEYTQQQVADACGLDRSELSEIELGDRDTLRVTILYALAQVLAISTDVLLGWRVEDIA